MIEGMEKQSDHDLLIRVDENVKNLIIEIKTMRDSTQEKILDHEMRIRRLEIWGAMAVGGAYALEFALKFILK